MNYLVVKKYLYIALTLVFQFALLAIGLLVFNPDRISYFPPINLFFIELSMPELYSLTLPMMIILWFSFFGVALINLFIFNRWFIEFNFSSRIYKFMRLFLICEMVI